MIHTETGNATIGSDKRHGGVDEDYTGSEISLLTLNNKGIHSKGLFLNLDWPLCGIPVIVEIMAG